MEENGRRRNPSRKASRALRSLDTNTFINKCQKSLCEDILADESQEQKNEGSATAWANDKNSNDNSRKENISQNVSAEKDIATVEHAVTSTVETVTPPTSEHAVSATEETIEEDEEALFTSKYPSKHPPNVVTFEMLEDYMHKPEYLDRNLLLEIIELGKPAFEILLRDGKAISMDDFRKANDISRTAQEAYSTGQTRITIPRVPCEDNEMNENYSKVCIYVIVFIDENGKIYVIKAGVNGDGKREYDYDLKSGRFQYIEIISFHAASDKAEAELIQLYKKFLQRMVKKADCPSDLCLLNQLALDGGMSCSLLRKPIMFAVESYVASEFGVETHLNCNPHEFIVGTEAIVREQKRIHNDTSDAMICDIKKITEIVN